MRKASQQKSRVSDQGKVGEGSPCRPRGQASQAPADGGGDHEECKGRGKLQVKRAGGARGTRAPSRPTRSTAEYWVLMSSLSFLVEVVV